MDTSEVIKIRFTKIEDGAVTFTARIRSEIGWVFFHDQVISEGGSWTLSDGNDKAEDGSVVLGREFDDFEGLLNI